MVAEAGAAIPVLRAGHEAQRDRFGRLGQRVVDRRDRQRRRGRAGWDGDRADQRAVVDAGRRGAADGVGDGLRRPLVPRVNVKTPPSSPCSSACGSLAVIETADQSGPGGTTSIGVPRALVPPAQMSPPTDRGHRPLHDQRRRSGDALDDGAEPASGRVREGGGDAHGPAALGADGQRRRCGAAVLVVQRDPGRGGRRARVGDEEVGLGVSGPSCSPSASAQRAAVAVEPGELCPSRHQFAPDIGPGHHIARSTITGTPLVERTIVETAVLARRRLSWST